MTPSEIVAHGFTASPVVMMNEAHNGMARCARTRRIGREILPAAHDAGCRHLAMEAIPNAGEGPTLLTSPAGIGYLAQPEMRDFVDAAVRLGWTFVAYEINSQDDALTMEATCRRRIRRSSEDRNRLHVLVLTETLRSANWARPEGT
jgi:hypothetical protein